MNNRPFNEVMRLQQNINLRDELLDEACPMFRWTIEGRVLAGLHGLGRIARHLGLRKKR